MPPVSGNIAPSSAYIKAPNKENIPAMTHTNVNQTGEPNCPAMEAGFINTPDPIMLPTIIEVAAQKPMVLAREELVVDILVEEDKKEV